MDDDYTELFPVYHSMPYPSTYSISGMPCFTIVPAGQGDLGHSGWLEAWTYFETGELGESCDSETMLKIWKNESYESRDW